MARMQGTKTKETKMPNAIQTLYYHAKNSAQEAEMINLVNQLISKKPTFDGKSLVLDVLLRVLPTELKDVDQREAKRQAS